MQRKQFLTSKIDELWTAPKFEKTVIGALKKQGFFLLNSFKGIKVSVSEIIEICLRDDQILFVIKQLYLHDIMKSE